MRVPRILAVCMLCLPVLAASGCATGLRLYVNPQADPGSYTKIAMLPFINMSGDQLAADRVLRAFESALLATNRYSILGSAEFYPMLQSGGVEPNRIAADPAKLKAVTSAAGITGILRGSVSEYHTVRAGQEEYPVVSFDVELIDGPTATVVWRATVTARGRSSLWLLGMSGERSFSQVTQSACERAVAALRGKGF